MSEIRVTSVVGENGGDRVGLTTGLTVGPLTGTTGIGATISHQGHAQFAGVCTATSFVGNGAGLTNVGITEVDQWYLSADQGSNGDVTSNLSRNNFTGNASPLGTGMSESSGIFTFPSTGKWIVFVQATFNLAGNDNVVLYINATTDNNTYSIINMLVDGQTGSSSENKHGSSSGLSFIDVTNTSQVKIKFSVGSISTGSNLHGRSDRVVTGFTFIRIGDT